MRQEISKPNWQTPYMFRPIFHLNFNFIEHILKNQYDINKMKEKRIPIHDRHICILRF